MKNEITVKINCSIIELNEILQNKNFKIIEKFYLDDTYYIPKKLQVKNMSARDVLSKAIILRNVIESYPARKRNIKLTVKKKEINEKGDIIKQSKTDCEIKDKKMGNKFLIAIGYRRLMNIKEEDIVYEKGELKLAVKLVKNGENLIEIETVENNPKLDTIDKLKERIKEIRIPIDTNDYFIKKAEIMLTKVL